MGNYNMFDFCSFKALSRIVMNGLINFIMRFYTNENKR